MQQGQNGSHYGQYGRQTYDSSQARDNNPFGFLKEAQLPFDTIQQIGVSDQPISIASFLRRDDGLQAQMAADYNRTYNQYRRDLPPDDVRAFGSMEMPYGGMQQANAYQLVQIANLRERYKTTIRENDKTLGRTTPASVDDLSITQLMEYYSRQRSELESEMNAWFYGTGIVLASEALGGFLSGNTGIYALDRYANFHSLPGRLREMKNEPWWNYSLRQISQDSAIGGSPGMAFALQIGLALVGSAQEGMSQHDAKLREDKKAEEVKLVEAAKRAQERAGRLQEPEESEEAGRATKTTEPQAEEDHHQTSEAPSQSGSRPLESSGGRPLVSRRGPVQVRLPKATAVRRNSKEEDENSKKIKDHVSAHSFPPSTGES
jgi:hypothetical protein